MIQSRRVNLLLSFTVLAATYYVAGKLGLRLAFAHPSATAVWPPTGIALAAFLILGYRIWPAVFVGAFLVNVTTAGTVATSIAIGVGNTLEGLLGSYLVNRFAGGRDTPESPGELLQVHPAGSCGEHGPQRHVWSDEPVFGWFRALDGLRIDLADLVVGRHGGQFGRRSIAVGLEWATSRCGAAWDRS